MISVQKKNTILPPKSDRHCRVVGAIFPIFQPQAPWTFKTKRTIWLIFTYMNLYNIRVYIYIHIKVTISSSFPRVSVVFVPPFLRRARHRGAAGRGQRLRRHLRGAAAAGAAAGDQEPRAGPCHRTPTRKERRWDEQHEVIKKSFYIMYDI